MERFAQQVGEIKKQNLRFGFFFFIKCLIDSIPTLEEGVFHNDVIVDATRVVFADAFRRQNYQHDVDACECQASWDAHAECANIPINLYECELFSILCLFYHPCCIGL